MIVHELINSEIMGSHTQAFRLSACLLLFVRMHARSFVFVFVEKPARRVTCLCVNDKREFNGEPISFCGDGHRPKIVAQFHLKQMVHCE